MLAENRDSTSLEGVSSYQLKKLIFKALKVAKFLLPQVRGEISPYYLPS